MEGRNLLNHHQCTASYWMMRWQPYSNRTLTTHQLIAGEEMSKEANMGMVKGHVDGQMPNLARMPPGLHPYSFSNTFWDF